MTHMAKKNRRTAKEAAAPTPTPPSEPPAEPSRPDAGPAASEPARSANRPPSPTDAEAAETGSSSTSAGQAEKTVPAWRAGLDFVVMLAGAVLVALAIKAYIVDVYLIPSGSMETALHGRPDGGDRIFCSKLTYRFRKPERWEIAVFEFPYENLRQTDEYGIGEQYKGQNFVKRIVGMPGEALVIGKGDIWVRKDGDRDYRRVVKPDRVQRGMWLKTYQQDFRDRTLAEVERFWRIIGDDASLPAGGPLVLAKNGAGVRLEYRPLVPIGERRETLLEMPGIPDRYVLEQPIQFRCQNRLANGELCGHVFVKAMETHNVEARCPHCGYLDDETMAIFYQRRSGLPAVGRYGVNPRYAIQGEEVGPRQTEYHIVPDLRMVTEAVFGSTQAELLITLREDSRFVQGVVSGDGRVEIRVNGAAAEPLHQAVAPVQVGKRHRIEFYIVDGQGRLFIDSDEAALLDEVIWDDKRPYPRSLPKTSGVGLSAAGGDVRIENIQIDRDVFYYSGWENQGGERFSGMSSNGEVYIGQDAFLPMGDHCVSSYDARSWGPVSLSLLRGPALYIWWPPERIRKIPTP